MKKKLKFIHITKNAGTSIENIAKEKTISWGRFDQTFQGKSDFPVEKWHLTCNLNPKFDYFCVVRNPYDRIISEFHCKYSNPTLLDSVWSKESFNKFVQDKIKYCKKLLVNNFHPGGHYCPQYYYINNYTDILIHIIKYENINIEFNDLMKLYSIPITFNRHDNKSSSKFFTTKDFDKVTIDIINDFYEKDFEIFNYTKKIYL